MGFWMGTRCRVVRRDERSHTSYHSSSDLEPDYGISDIRTDSTDMIHVGGLNSKHLKQISKSALVMSLMHKLATAEGSSARPGQVYLHRPGKRFMAHADMNLQIGRARITIY